MSRPPQLEPAWLVGLLVAWSRRTSRDHGLGFPSVCVMLKDGIPGRVRSYEPTGYGGAEIDGCEQAINRLSLMRKRAVMRYFKPWMAPAIDRELADAGIPIKDSATWLRYLRAALAELAEELQPRRAGYKFPV